MLTARFDCPDGPLPVLMHASDATAERLLKHGPLGADLIRFPAGGRVPTHTHPGAHMLFVLSGDGWVDCGKESVRLNPGVCYLVPAEAAHGIRAETELTLISVANDHRDAGSQERLNVVAE